MQANDFIIHFLDYDSCIGCPKSCNDTEPTQMCVSNVTKKFTCLYGFASLTWTGPDPLLYLDFDVGENLTLLQGSSLYDFGQVGFAL